MATGFFEQPILIAKVTAIDGLVTGTTDILVNQSSAVGIVLFKILMRTRQATNLLTPASISIGHNATAYDNVRANAALPTPSVNNYAAIEDDDGATFSQLVENSTLKVNVQTAGTVGIGGAYSFDLILLGYYEPFVS